MHIRLSQHRTFPRPERNRGRSLLLFLPLGLFGALGAGRELLTPSLTELAFYSLAILAAMALATGLGVLTVKLLAGSDGKM